MVRVYVRYVRESIGKEKSAAVFAVRRANYTHRRKGVFNAESIEDSTHTGNVRFRTKTTAIGNSTLEKYKRICP